MKNTKTQTAAESKAQLISLHEELARLRKKGCTWTKQKKIQKAIDKLNGEVIADEERDGTFGDWTTGGETEDDERSNGGAK